MIKLTAISLIHSISPVMQVTERFSKRELILDDSYTKDGQTFTNLVKVEFTGDRMALLDQFQSGQRVQVEACINGRAARNGEIYNTIRGLSIIPYVVQQQNAGQAYAQPQQPQSAPAYPQQGYQQPAQGYAQGPQGYMHQQGGLPF